MSVLKWEILDKEKSNAVLDILNNNKDAIVFSKQLTEVSCKSLPFYQKYKLYKLTNYSTLPIFVMKYLSDGNDFYTVDGLANTIYTVNKVDKIYLTEDNIIPYLAFFFNNVQGNEGDVFLIRDPERIPLADTLSPSLRQNIIDKFRPIKIETLSGSKGIKVCATIIYGDALIYAEMIIGELGRIFFEKQQLLVNGIHLPTSLFNNYNSYVEN